MINKLKFNIVLIIIIILLVIVLISVLFNNQKDNKINSFKENIHQEYQNQNQNEGLIGNININNIERNPSRYACIGEFCDGSGSDNQDSLTVLKIPLTTPGGNIGCGSKIFFSPHTVPKTTAVLDATYKMLFDIKLEPEVKTDVITNEIGAYKKLFYKSVSIKDGVAKVMLTGSMYGPGGCSFPVIREQINQSAFQFNTVNKIEVYLNGEIFDWCLVSDADASDSKCNITPKYWIDEK